MRKEKAPPDAQSREADLGLVSSGPDEPAEAGKPRQCNHEAPSEEGGIERSARGDGDSADRSPGTQNERQKRH